MSKLLLATVLSLSLIIVSEQVNGQVRSGVPVAHTPAQNVSSVPKKVQQSFEEAMSFGSLMVLDKPMWKHQNGLYTVTCRATGDYGPGSCTMRFKPYGGLVLFAYQPDKEPEYPLD